jgi:hypothetical protein
MKGTDPGQGYISLIRTGSMIFIPEVFLPLLFKLAGAKGETKAEGQQQNKFFRGPKSSHTRKVLSE